jgi:predicted SnoaL-like aldol condensation-catalyzing enzyme
MKKPIATLLATTMLAATVTGCTNNQSKEDTNMKTAINLISSFATGDTTVAKNNLTEGYIQHNLAYGTGRDAFVGSVEYLGSAPTKTTVENIRAFQDGDYVFLHTIYNFAGSGDQVAFDVFRYENGKIAEHWDNLAALAPANPSGRTQTDGPTEVTDLDKTEANKALCEQFVKDVLMGQNSDKLTSYFDGDTYIQHNIQIADGLSGLGAALAAMADAGIEMKYDKIHMVLGQGNFVLAISEGTFGGAPTSYYDLWRVENGKIVEHWDVMETIAEQSTWANQNGKF